MLLVLCEVQPLQHPEAPPIHCMLDNANSVAGIALRGQRCLPLQEGHTDPICTLLQTCAVLGCCFLLTNPFLR